MSHRPLTQPGFWPHTGNINFCEPDYEVSHYIAEFWNSVSSIPMILTGVFGMCLARWQHLGPEQMACYFGVGLVGCGSFAFHATLMRTGQIADEVPMLWSILFLLYAARQHSLDRQSRVTRSTSISTRLFVLRCALIAYAAIATCLYFFSGFGVFIMLYGVSVAVLVVYAVYSLFTGTPPAGAQPRRLLAAAALAYGGGVVCFWLPSELLCDRAPLLRRLPLHALFHLTSAAGPHLGCTAFALARFEHEKAVARPSAWFAGLPAIERGLCKQV